MKLDLGCGTHCRDGYTGVDIFAGNNPDIVADICKPIPGIADNSVDAVNCSHVLEHLPGDDWRHALAEMARMLKPGSTFEIFVPHPASECAMVNGHLGVLTPRWWHDMKRDDWLHGSLVIDTIVECRNEQAVKDGVFATDNALLNFLRPYLWNTHTQTAITGHKP